MRKILFATLIASMAFAVNSAAQITVGAGYANASHVDKVKSGSDSVSDKTGMSGIWIGGTYEWNFMKENWGDLSLLPGATYSFFGKKLKSESDEEDGYEYSYKQSRRDHYLDIPVSVKYAYDFGSVKAWAYAGPVFSFGLSAKSIYKAFEDDGETEYKNVTKAGLYSGKTSWKRYENGKVVESGKEKGESDYSMFDIKLGLGLGVTVFEKYDVKLGYNIGILNRYTGEQSDDYKFKSKTNVFYFGVAYHF